jgi:RCR-type E3 ubiquitin transferase
LKLVYYFYDFQREKKVTLAHTWGLKEVLVRFLNIISRPVRVAIENIYHNQQSNMDMFKRTINHKLIVSCCQLLIKMMSEIIFQNGAFEVRTFKSQ